MSSDVDVDAKGTKSEMNSSTLYKIYAQRLIVLLLLVPVIAALTILSSLQRENQEPTHKEWLLMYWRVTTWVDWCFSLPSNIRKWAGSVFTKKGTDDSST